MAIKHKIAADRLLKDLAIAYDTLGCMAYMCRRIHPETGEEYQIQRIVGGPKVTPTVSEIRTRLLASLAVVKSYTNENITFNNTGHYNASVSSVMIQNGVTKKEYEDDVALVDDVATYIEPLINVVIDEAGLITIADYIDANIDKIPMPRRKWNLGNVSISALASK